MRGDKGRPLRGPCAPVYCIAGCERLLGVTWYKECMVQGHSTLLVSTGLVPGCRSSHILTRCPRSARSEHKAAILKTVGELSETSEKRKEPAN